jgi:hypothetical protein
MTMATQPPPETPFSPEPTQPTQPSPEFEQPAPDVDIPDMDPATNPSTISGGDIDDRGLFASASTVGFPDGEADRIGDTDRMTASTGGLAGTSR